MKTNYVLIDYESVRVASLALLNSEHFRVWVFLGPNNTKLDTTLVLAIQGFRERAEYVTLSTPGTNALDFHIAYYLGTLAKADPTGSFHIISKDKGFDPLIHHLKAKKISVARSISIEAMPCFESRKDPSASRSKLSDEELFTVVIVDLIKRKMAQPRTSKKLLSTMRAVCGTEIEASRIDTVYATLLKRRYIKVDGTKVTYDLPLEPKSKSPGQLI